MSEETNESVPHAAPVVEAQSADRHEGERISTTYVRWLPGRTDTMRNERGLTNVDQRRLGVEEPKGELWWNADNGHRISKEKVLDYLGADGYERAIRLDGDFAEIEV